MIDQSDRKAETKLFLFLHLLSCSRSFEIFSRQKEGQEKVFDLFFSLWFLLLSWRPFLLERIVSCALAGSGLTVQHGSVVSLAASSYYGHDQGLVATQQHGGHGQQQHGGGNGGGNGGSGNGAHSPGKYQENGHDTFSDFVTLVCQEAQNTQNAQVSRLRHTSISKWLFCLETIEWRQRPLESRIVKFNRPFLIGYRANNDTITRWSLISFKQNWYETESN